MSLYNMVHGINPNAGALLHMVGLDPRAIQRLRDAWLEWSDDTKTVPMINVYTRTGGNNREDHAEGNTYLTSNSFYVSDRDDNFDNTYANWRFSIPPHRLAEVMDFIASCGVSPSSEVRWKATIDALKAMPSG